MTSQIRGIPSATLASLEWPGEHHFRALSDPKTIRPGSCATAKQRNLVMTGEVRPDVIRRNFTRFEILNSLTTLL